MTAAWLIVWSQDFQLSPHFVTHINIQLSGKSLVWYLEALHKCGNRPGRRCYGGYQDVDCFLSATRSEMLKTRLWYQHLSIISHKKSMPQIQKEIMTWQPSTLVAWCSHYRFSLLVYTFLSLILSSKQNKPHNFNKFFSLDHETFSLCCKDTCWGFEAAHSYKLS